MPRQAEDLSGKKFNYLTVIERDYNYPVKGVFWKCVCECGKEKTVRADRLKSGETKSCGCYSTQKLIDYNKNVAANNLTNQVFGKWKVLKRTDKRQSGSIIWLCQCECGTLKEIRATSLISGETKSCGCIQYKDITNQKFGILTAIKEVQKGTKTSYSKWLCKCDCGKEKIVNKRDLLRGHILSCGCLKMSKGEFKIKQILEDNCIQFKQEKRFEDCKDQTFLPFDFYVNDEYIIEYDGIQHFDFKNSGWNTEENFKITQKHDEIKNQYCLDNKIPIIRIPYTHYDDLCLEDLTPETSKFLIN